jgi:hypothetical protein
MSEIQNPGAPNALPSGVAKISVSGGLPFIVLPDHMAAADFIEFTGVISAQNITIIIPQPIFPQMVNGNVSYSGPTIGAWTKYFKNSTSGNFALSVQPKGSGQAIAIPQNAAVPVVWNTSTIDYGGAASTSPTSILVAQADTDLTVNTLLPGTFLSGTAFAGFFYGRTILVEVDWAGSSAQANSAVQISIAIDGVQQGKMGSFSSPSPGVIGGTPFSIVVLNPPSSTGTLRTFQAFLSTGTPAVNVSILAASNPFEYCIMKLTDLP